MAEPSLRESLIRLLQRSHGDMMDVVQVADQAQWNQLAIENFENARDQANTQFQAICPGHEPQEEDDEMSRNVFINAGLMADQATTQALMQAMAQESQGPQAPDPQIPIDRQQSSPVWGFVKKMLPFLATAGIAIAAARYFMPADTDTRNEFDIRAGEFIPEPTGDDSAEIEDREVIGIGGFRTA